MKKSNPYFEWLCDQVNCESYKGEDYTMVLRSLYDTPFNYIIDKDANRYDDGISLQKEYVGRMKGRPYDTDISPRERLEFSIHYGCSILEMLIALSRRMSFIMDECDIDSSPQRWFWEMMDNLGLRTFSDSNMMFSSDVYSFAKVNDVLSTLIDRKYAKNGGNGGLFPVLKPNKNHRKLEIWYQMMEYFGEKYEEIPHLNDENL